MKIACRLADANSDGIEARFPDPDETSPLVVHAPRTRTFKGTEFVRAAIDTGTGREQRGCEHEEPQLGCQRRMKFRRCCDDGRVKGPEFINT